ncbi:MAG: hypothetical protein LJE97_12620 [Betaproteobacteria bacterium]|jgi:hypothetical protein|nr:hypothetical protein [Betaproteobacteria bacterium]
MTRARTFLGRHATTCIVLAACLAASAPVTVTGQTVERKPAPAAKDRATKDEKTPQPRTARPDARDKQRGDERIRIDAPVSFPVDI